MRRIGTRLVVEKKAAIQAEKDGRPIDSKGANGRDLLSLLIKANMAVDVRTDGQQMDDEEVLGRKPPFVDLRLHL